MTGLATQALGALVQVQNLAGAAVLAAFVSLGLRSVALTFMDRERGRLATFGRALVGLAFLALAVLYGVFSAPILAWDLRAAGLAGAMALLVLVPLAVRHVVGRPARRPGLTAVLVQIILLLTLLLVATITLMRAGFLALTQDRTVLLLDVTGESGTQVVRWAPPDQPARDERLTTHRVVFRTPEGARVAEAWLYGDEVAVKGRVLRLSPILNAAGVPNLFELLFAHNGYAAADRHNAAPHLAVPLPSLGPLAVHPWWRPMQARILERWEKGTSAESTWGIRSATTESTYYPLVDEEGRPVQRTYRLVLTPGGLSAS